MPGFTYITAIGTLRIRAAHLGVAGKLPTHNALRDRFLVVGPGNIVPCLAAG